MRCSQQKIIYYHYITLLKNHLTNSANHVSIYVLCEGFACGFAAQSICWPQASILITNGAMHQKENLIMSTAIASLLLTLRTLASKPCPECGEVHILVWQKACAFCDVGEGKVAE